MPNKTGNRPPGRKSANNETSRIRDRDARGRAPDISRCAQGFIGMRTHRGYASGNLFEPTGKLKSCFRRIWRRARNFSSNVLIRLKRVKGEESIVRICLPVLRVPTPRFLDFSWSCVRLRMQAWNAASWMLRWALRISSKCGWGSRDTRNTVYWWTNGGLRILGIWCDGVSEAKYKCSSCVQRLYPCDRTSFIRTN